MRRQLELILSLKLPVIIKIQHFSLRGVMVDRERTGVSLVPPSLHCQSEQMKTTENNQNENTLSSQLFFKIMHVCYC